MKPIKSRGFNCLIELWEVSNAPDGAGGLITSESLVGEIFARRMDASGSNYNKEGASIDKFDASFIIRKTTIDSTVNFIVYGGYKYTILSMNGTQMESQIKLNCINTNTLR